MNYNVKKVKIFVTVPKENLEAVRTAMCNAGAGVIGNYTFVQLQLNQSVRLFQMIMQIHILGNRTN